jgi:hypothetical protein
MRAAVVATRRRAARGALERSGGGLVGLVGGDASGGAARRGGKARLGQEGAQRGADPLRRRVRRERDACVELPARLALNA